MKHVAGLTFIGWLTGVQLLAAADPGSNSRLFKAIRDGDVEAIRRSIETEADLNARDDRGNSPLHLAALNLDADTVARLVKAGANPNARNKWGNTPLIYSASSTGESKGSSELLLWRAPLVSRSFTVSTSPPSTALRISSESFGSGFAP